MIPSKVPKILIIEDDQFTRELYEEILLQEGYIVVAVPDGLEAVEELETTTYDLILLDIMLPKMDGLSVLRRMSSNKFVNKPKDVVVMTNMANASILAEAKAEGVRECLIKSNLDPKKLIEYVALQVGVVA